jgi:pimeloyl-ACP methyl ester carboxylesterase
MANKIIQSFLPKLIGLRLMAMYKIKPKKAVYKAFKLFCTPRGGFVKPHQKDFLNAHKAEQIQFKKIKIQTYRWKGNGPKVLLLHGWDSHSFRWKDLVKHLKSKDYDIMAFDAPAQGYSEGNLLSVPIYNEVLNKVFKHFDPEILVGHSMGGMTAIYNQYLEVNPNIKKLILLGAPSDLKRIMDGFQKILRLSDKFMRATEQYFKERYGFFFSEFNSKYFAKNIKIPTLIIHDKYDKIVPYNEAQDIHQAIENAELMITEGAGHSLHKERIYLNILHFIEKD